MARTLRTSDNGAGHNSSGMIDGSALKRFVQRVGNLMQKQKDLAEDIKEVCGECDEAGVASKKEVRRRARESLMDPEILRAQLERDDALRHALGWLADTPLGVAAVEAAAEPARTERPRRNKVVPIAGAIAKAQEHLRGDEHPGEEVLTLGAAPAPYEDELTRD